MKKKRNQIAYKVFISQGANRATNICITYSIDTQNVAFSAEFYTLVSTFGDEGLKVPSGGTYTFREEMILNWYAAAVAPERRHNIIEWLQQKMAEAYGHLDLIDIQVISG